MPHGQKNQNVKQKQYCNKFNKDKKEVYIKKILKKKEMKASTDITLPLSTVWAVFCV